MGVEVYGCVGVKGAASMRVLAHGKNSTKIIF